MSPIATGASCTAFAPDVAASAVLDTAAKGYVRAALELAQHDPSLVESWRGPEGWWPHERRPVVEITAAVDALARTLAGVDPASLPEPLRQRARYLEGQVRALGLAGRRLLGVTTSFGEEAREGLGLPGAPAVDATAVAGARAALEGELSGTSRLVERVAEVRARLRVPADRRDAVMQEALSACRKAAADSLAWSAEESVEVTFVSPLGWDAYARPIAPHRTRIDVNAAEPLDLARALRLACHEGYPGHHVQHLWIDDELVSGRGWTEFLMTPGFGPHLLVSEGAAEAGVDLAMPPARRADTYRRLARVAGLPSIDADQLVRVEDLLAAIEPVIGEIAAEYLDNRINGQRALERLADAALAANPERLLSFIERRRARVLAYPQGRRVVREALGSRGLSGMRALFVDNVLATADRTRGVP